MSFQSSNVFLQYFILSLKTPNKQISLSSPLCMSVLSSMAHWTNPCGTPLLKANSLLLAKLLGFFLLAGASSSSLLFSHDSLVGHTRKNYWLPRLKDLPGTLCGKGTPILGNCCPNTCLFSLTEDIFQSLCLLKTFHDSTTCYLF